MNEIMNLSFTNDLQDLVAFIERYQFFCLLGHESPDGDCIMSQLALASFLKRLNKEVALVSAGPFHRNEIKAYANQFSHELPLQRLEHDDAAVMIVDCATLERTGYEAVPCLIRIIDHHASVEERCLSGYRDAQAPSTTILIMRLMQAFDMQPTYEEARCIFLGFCTDTGFFRHLTPSMAPYLQDVATLLSYGLVVADFYDQVEGAFSLDSRRYTGTLLANTESYADGKLLLIYDQYKNDKLDRDSTLLYRTLLLVEGVEVVALVKPKEGGFSIGLRSKGAVNVGQLAASFGGGGHPKASGFFTEVVFDEVKTRLIQACQVSSGDK